MKSALAPRMSTGSVLPCHGAGDEPVRCPRTVASAAGAGSAWAEQPYAAASASSRVWYTLRAPAMPVVEKTRATSPGGQTTTRPTACLAARRAAAIRSPSPAESMNASPVKSTSRLRRAVVQDLVDAGAKRRGREGIQLSGDLHHGQAAHGLAYQDAEPVVAHRGHLPLPFACALAHQEGISNVLGIA